METACDIWQYLETSFASSTKGREYALVIQMHTIEKGTDSVEEYLRKFKINCDELTAIQKSPSDLDKVFWAVKGLSSKYGSFTNALLVKPPLPTFAEFVESLKGNEKRMQLLKKHDTAPNECRAFVRQQQGRGNRFNHDRFVNKVRIGQYRSQSHVQSQGQVS